ncbi:MAG: cytochrome c oxidase subunit 3 [Bacteroidota bacterium]
MSSLDLRMEEKNYIVHPQKFGLWLFILTIIMIFGGFTSAYIVQVDSIDLASRTTYDLPSILGRNLIVMLVSSVTMQFAIWAAKREQNLQAIMGLSMTLFLGLFFLWGQWQAFQELTSSGLPFIDKERADNSVAFFYVITGVHGAHIVAAILVVVVTLLQTAFAGFRAGRKKIAYELTGIFWHFLGLLWVYLYLFLKFVPDTLKESV